jgi:diguanylate cyclase (GGDEF)-like protein
MNNLFFLNVLDKLNEGIIILNKDLEICMWNGYLESFTGKIKEEVIGKKIYDVSPLLKNNMYIDIFKNALKNGESRFCSGVLHKAFIPSKNKDINKELRQSMQVNIIEYNKNIYILIQIMNVTSQYERVKKLKSYIKKLDYTKKELEESEKRYKILFEKVKQFAYYDSLTGLPNRKLFMETLNRTILEKNKFSVIFLDMDKFKNINDTYGHDIGDKFLIQVSKRLKNVITKDDMVARLGGDEFVILQLNIDSKLDCVKVAQKITKVLDKPINVGNITLYTSASIGVAIYPDDGQDKNILLKNADTAMYKAKELKKNKFKFFNNSMYKSISYKTKIENDIRRALKNNEFEIYYQPQIDIFTKKIVGLEALLRWNNPFLGIIFPDDFISVAEESGLIIPIGEWTIKNCCMQMKKWIDKGYFLNSVAINVSAIQLEQSNFEMIIKNALKKTGVPPYLLEIEITERKVMKRLEESISLLKRLKKMGIKIALDDFGTGCSSLSYLKKLPINTLKLDKSFMDKISKGNNEEAILDGVILLAHKMKIDVVIEGVESEEQFDIIKNKKCDKVQGYLFGKPVPAYEIEEKLSRKSIKNDNTM